MLVKSLELKNISENIITIGDYSLSPKEVINIPLSKIDNIMWRNIIFLVNNKEVEYKIVDTEILDTEDKKVNELKRTTKKPEKVQEKKNDEKKDTKTTRESRTTKKDTKTTATKKVTTKKKKGEK